MKLMKPPIRKDSAILKILNKDRQKQQPPKHWELLPVDFFIRLNDSSNQLLMSRFPGFRKVGVLRIVPERSIAQAVG